MTAALRLYRPAPQVGNFPTPADPLAAAAAAARVAELKRLMPAYAACHPAALLRLAVRVQAAAVAERDWQLAADAAVLAGQALAGVLAGGEALLDRLLDLDAAAGERDDLHRAAARDLAGLFGRRLRTSYGRGRYDATRDICGRASAPATDPGTVNAGYRRAGATP